MQSSFLLTMFVTIRKKRKSFMTSRATLINQFTQDRIDHVFSPGGRISFWLPYPNEKLI